MAERKAVLLENRGLLRLAGEDLRSFLQGIVSNDVERIAADRAIWSAFLTPQGKFLHEFFLAQAESDESGPGLLLDGEAERLDDLKRRLSLYRLRSKVTIEDAREALAVYALIGDGALDALGLGADPGQACRLGAGRAFVDPRLAALGARAILPRGAAEATLAQAGFESADVGAYERLRLAQGVPDGSRDLEVEKSILLENGFDELHGVDWDKGCYMGQELTARTRYRALIKKRLLPVAVEGPLPEPGTPLLRAGKEVGVMRSAREGLGLALLRLEALEPADSPILAGEATVTPSRPAWLRLDSSAQKAG